MSSTSAAFYFDLASPLAYIAAERVLQVLPGPAEWQPVLARELSDGRSCNHGGVAAEDSASVTHATSFTDEARAALAARAAALGLQPLRWPDPFPFDSTLAMRVATYAKSIGRTVPFVQAAFRQAFAGGHSLQNEDFVLIAAAACEMHPAAVLRAARLRSVSEQLDAATAAAHALGVREVPAVSVAREVFAGDGCLERAATAMTKASAATTQGTDAQGTTTTPGRADAAGAAALAITHFEGKQR